MKHTRYYLNEMFYTDPDSHRLHIIKSFLDCDDNLFDYYLKTFIPKGTRFYLRFLVPADDELYEIIKYIRFHNHEFKSIIYKRKTKIISRKSNISYITRYIKKPRNIKMIRKDICNFDIKKFANIEISLFDLSCVYI